jgi:hypothetical protein
MLMNVGYIFSRLEARMLQFLTIGEVARRPGVTTSALR